MDIVLASASPRRQELLKNMGIRDFEVLPSLHEPPLDLNLQPGPAVEEIALGKARDAAARRPGSLVIAADTLVFLDGSPLGKPASESEAAGMLRRLSGRRHEVITGLAVISAGRESTEHALTYVKFRELSEAEIDWYVSTGEPMDKAGAYGIQGLGGLLIEGLEGDYFNVVGLPVAKLALMLKGAGLDVFRICKGAGN